GRGVVPFKNLETNDVLAFPRDFERKKREVRANVVDALAHEPLDRKHGVLGILHHLLSGAGADENGSTLIEVNDGGHEPTAVRPGYHFGSAVLDDRDETVCCS